MEIEVGDWVHVKWRKSEATDAVIPSYKGVVHAINGDTVNLIEVKTHGMRTAPIGQIELINMRTRSARRMIDKFLTEHRDKPRFRNPGNRELPHSTKSANFIETVAERHIKALSAPRRQQMAAKKSGSSKAKTTKPKRTRKAPDLSGVKAEDFFQENAKGKSVFRPGWDAKFAGILKRVANDNATADDKRLAGAKTILNHEKVSESAHFQHLLAEIG